MYDSSHFLLSRSADKRARFYNLSFDCTIVTSIPLLTKHLTKITSEQSRDKRSPLQIPHKI